MRYSENKVYGAVALICVVYVLCCSHTSHWLYCSRKVSVGLKCLIYVWVEQCSSGFLAFQGLSSEDMTSGSDSTFPPSPLTSRFYPVLCHYPLLLSYLPPSCWFVCFVFLYVCFLTTTIPPHPLLRLVDPPLPFVGSGWRSTVDLFTQTERRNKSFMRRCSLPFLRPPPLSPDFGGNTVDVCVTSSWCVLHVVVVTVYIPSCLQGNWRHSKLKPRHIKPLRTEPYKYHPPFPSYDWAALYLKVEWKSTTYKSELFGYSLYRQLKSGAKKAEKLSLLVISCSETSI